MIEHPHRDHIKDTTGIKRLWQTKLVQIIFNFCKKMGKACEHWLIKIPSQGGSLISTFVQNLSRTSPVR